MVNETVTITFYTKPNCPLCEDAEELLESLTRKYRLLVAKQDILRDRALYDLYWNRIPVLEFPDGSTLEPAITPERLEARLKAIASWRVSGTN